VQTCKLFFGKKEFECTYLLSRYFQNFFQGF
jgi:hypothetical protein